MLVILSALSISTLVKAEDVQELLQTCSKDLLPKQEGSYWHCEKEEPTLGDTCRVECSDDHVVEQEKVLVCTMQGWGPKQANGSLGEIPGCVPNSCPNLMEKKIRHGEWKCKNHNTSKSCNNYRVGEVCSLDCKGKYQASLGHITVCTAEGWLPSGEDLRCYGCKIPNNPANGTWACDVDKEGSTVCLLDCNKGFSLKGSHMIECDHKTGKFSKNPGQSFCVESRNTIGENPFDEPDDYEMRSQKIITRKEDPKIQILKKRTPELLTKKSNDSKTPTKIDREDLITQILERKPIYTKDPFTPKEFRRIKPKEFEEAVLKTFECEPGKKQVNSSDESNNIAESGTEKIEKDSQNDQIMPEDEKTSKENLNNEEIGQEEAKSESKEDIDREQTEPTKTQEEQTPSTKMITNAGESELDSETEKNTDDENKESLNTSDKPQEKKDDEENADEKATTESKDENENSDNKESESDIENETTIANNKEEVSDSPEDSIDIANTDTKMYKETESETENNETLAGSYSESNKREESSKTEVNKENLQDEKQSTGEEISSATEKDADETEKSDQSETDSQNETATENMSDKSSISDEDEVKDEQNELKQNETAESKIEMNAETEEKSEEKSTNIPADDKIGDASKIAKGGFKDSEDIETVTNGVDISTIKEGSEGRSENFVLKIQNSSKSANEETNESVSKLTESKQSSKESVNSVRENNEESDTEGKEDNKGDMNKVSKKEESKRKNDMDYATENKKTHETDDEENSSAKNLQDDNVTKSTESMMELEFDLGHDDSNEGTGLNFDSAGKADETNTDASLFETKSTSKYISSNEKDLSETTPLAEPNEGKGAEAQNEENNPENEVNTEQISTAKKYEEITESDNEESKKEDEVESSSANINQENENKDIDDKNEKESQTEKNDEDGEERDQDENLEEKKETKTDDRYQGSKSESKSGRHSSQSFSENNEETREEMTEKKRVIFNEQTVKEIVEKKPINSNSSFHNMKETSINRKSSSSYSEKRDTGIAKDCKSPPWKESEKWETWECMPALPPYEKCSLICKKDGKGELKTSVSGGQITWNCNQKVTMTWNATRVQTCKKCHEKASLGINGKCKCEAGFAGNGFQCGKDTDFDDIPDEALDCDDRACNADNCPSSPNPEQDDIDGDGKGDECDIDPDNDGVELRQNEEKCPDKKAIRIAKIYKKCVRKGKCNDKEIKKYKECFKIDNCAKRPNKDQKDSDEDGRGDACDNCILVKNQMQNDKDNDGIGDECDDDSDNDGIKNDDDNCELMENTDQKDSDGDGLGDVCDNCPKVSNKDQLDINQNLIGDACEKGDDVDNDSLVGEGDNCPDIFNPDQHDIDNDFIGDLCDDDMDGDGIANEKDNCPLVPNPNQVEKANTGRGDACFSDFDGDGVEDEEDVCPENKDVFYTDFRNLETMNLCATHNVTKASAKNSCNKPAPQWDTSNNFGKEIVQNENSQVGIAVSRTLFGDVDYNGTIFVNSEQDDDWLGIVWGMTDINNFYLLVCNRNTKENGKPREGDPGKNLYWQIKHISVSPDRVNDPRKFDRMMDAIRWPRNVDGYSRILWVDPNKEMWKPKTSIKWTLKHRISTNEIELHLYESGKEISHAYIKDPDGKKLQGGRLGVFCWSQEKIKWSNLEFGCPIRHHMKEKETESTPEKYSDDTEDDSNENPSEPADENDSNEADSNEKD